MFRANMCSSSWETTVFMRHLVLVTLYGRLSGSQGPPCIPDSRPYRVTSTKCRINTVVSHNDEHIFPRNMYRKYINILRTIVHQVGFIYKNIIQRLWSISLAECQGRSLSHEVKFHNNWQGMEPVCRSGRWRCFVWMQLLQIMQKMKSCSPIGSLLTYPFIWTAYETEFKYVTGLYDFMNSTSVDSSFG